MEMGEGCDVPRVACQGARQEGGHVVDKVGEYHFDDILRKLGIWGRKRSSWLLGVSVE